MPFIFTLLSGIGTAITGIAGALSAITLSLMPLIMLYVKIKAVSLALKIVFLGLLYLAYNSFSQWVLNSLFVYLNAADFPCLVLFTLNELDLFSLFNLYLSWLSTIAVARYMFSRFGNLL